jgi:hypothetical protein
MFAGWRPGQGYARVVAEFNGTAPDGARLNEPLSLQ